MKKLLIIAVIGLLVLGGVFAGILNVNLGVAAMYNKGYNDFIEEQKVSVNDFSFGAAADIKLTFADIGATVLYSKVGDDSVLNGTVTADLALDIFLVRLSAGIGYEYVWNINQNIYSFGGVDDFADFKDAELLAHAGVDVLLDGIHIGVFASVPTGLTFNNFSEKIKGMDFDRIWERANYGLSVKLRLI